jgi:hypothetical protein
MVYKKSIFSVPILFIILFVVLFISSCNNNPVSPTQDIGFDSARYITIKYHIPFGPWYSYLADSTTIFVGEYGTLMLIKDSTQKFLLYGDNFSCNYMSGKDQEIYFVGQNWNDPTNYPKPRMKKWTGSGFQEIPIIDSSNEYYSLNTVFLASNNEVWVGGEKGNILKYYNGSFTKYKFDSTFQFSKFFQDELQNLYCMQERDSSNPEGTYRKEYQYFYKYLSQNWNLVYLYITETHYEIDTYITPCQVRNEIFGIGKDGIYKFDGNSYRKIINSDNFHLENYSSISGSSSTNLLVVGYEGSWSGFVNFYNWNGKKWSKEYTKIGLGYPMITYSNNNYLCSSAVDLSQGDIYYLKKLVK